ncbi:aminoglycoside phosphotransferase family protein [Maribacter algarum]|uniref:Aminoglycoside phosphotransferase family protein n=1 Tax=Maribacter algarum (ex Zhang et al. 2020) TaxID=2578118 RepID=A0A5S3PTZ6_9FLAO|nr:aminoglycoside phosphotransferase family protein [Maribacter algarum]TMM58388.1 aminoglycoside phosphotransferase family protein [Maribacter algarum]
MAVELGNYSEDGLRAILKEFKIAQNDYSFKSITAGYINDTFLVCNEEEPLFILQRINHNIFENIEGLMMNINRAFKYLKGGGYNQIKLIPALSGKAYASHKSGYWRVMTYIANSTTYDTTTEAEIAFEAGRIIGKFHTLLANEPIESYVDTIPKFHDLKLRKMQFLAALARASDKKKELASDAILFSQDMLVKLTSMHNEQLPKRVCHNDTKLNNILFSKETKRSLCLIDLDTLMTGYFHFDFGDAIRTIVNTAPEDEKEHGKITFEKKLFEAFVDGLASNDSFLNLEEIKALPYGVLLMPFLHGIRALTDYLNGNIYYKVAYENQNLDRCLSLFDFTKKALSNIDYMKTVLSEKLKS